MAAGRVLALKARLRVGLLTGAPGSRRDHTKIARRFIAGLDRPEKAIESRRDD